MIDLEEQGQVRLIAILLLTVLSIVIPAVVWWANQDMRASVRQKKSTGAFHLAEAGIDRARWRLGQDSSVWTATSTGTVSGYNFDVTYTDVPGGTYSISISSEPSNASQRIVIGVGRDISGKEVRTIKAVFKKPGVILQAALASGDHMQMKGSAAVHWGPIMSLPVIDMNGMSTVPRYPRLYSQNNI